MKYAICSFLGITHIEEKISCFKQPSIQVTWNPLLTVGCLLLNESSAESSCMSFLHYFHAAISSHLSEKPKYVLFYMVAKHRFDCIVSTLCIRSQIATIMQTIILLYPLFPKTIAGGWYTVIINLLRQYNSRGTIVVNFFVSVQLP